MQSSRKKEHIMKSRLLHEIYYAGIFWIQVLWPFYILLLIDGQDRHFYGVTSDIRNHERLENLQKKRRKKYLVFWIFYFCVAGQEKQNGKCKKKKKKGGLSWVVLNDQIIELKVTLIKRKHIEVIGAKHKRQRWINKIIFLRSWITYLLPRWGGINTGCITDKYIN